MSSERWTLDDCWEAVREIQRFRREQCKRDADARWEAYFAERPRRRRR